MFCSHNEVTIMDNFLTGVNTLSGPVLIDIGNSTVTCKVLLNWPHSKLGQYFADSLPNLGKRITRISNTNNWYLPLIISYRLGYVLIDRTSSYHRIKNPKTRVSIYSLLTISWLSACSASDASPKSSILVYLR